jgi:3-dehydroquinate synthase
MNSKAIKFKVNLKKRSYPISIGSDLSQNLSALLMNLPSKNAFVVSDRALKNLRSQFIKGLKKAKWNVAEIPVGAGEGLKDFKTTHEIYGKLLKLGAHRDSVLFALGGGSVGDAAGFVASTYLRGITWVGVPTTLLAQVDSSVGGKTAINHSQGKNLIGTFYQPAAVICDVTYLSSLSRREIISGLGEALKYGLIYDPQFFKFIKLNWNRLLAKETKGLEQVVQKSLQWKSKVVSQDEFDNKGRREFLNFGHTFGHALEKITDYKKFQHGEAIIWGMRYALALSQVKGVISTQEYEEIDSFLAGISLPPLPKNISAQKISKLMSKDKKIRGGRLHFVLLKKMGRPISASNVTAKNIRDAFLNLKARS